MLRSDFRDAVIKALEELNLSDDLQDQYERNPAAIKTILQNAFRKADDAIIQLPSDYDPDDYSIERRLDEIVREVGKRRR